MIRKEDNRTELDRATWAGPVQLILTYELTGIGEHTSEMIQFGTVFESKPFFAYGIELMEGQTLVDGDFPLGMAGVSEWDITEIDNEFETPFYLGAKVFFHTDTSSLYSYLFRLSFEGIAVRNTEHFRG
jgi:hypothetical protein